MRCVEFEGTNDIDAKQNSKAKNCFPKSSCILLPYWNMTRLHFSQLFSTMASLLVPFYAMLS